MSPTKASVSVLVSGILAILGSAFSIFGIAIGILGLSLAPQPETGPMVPAYVKSIALVSMLIFLVMAVFGVITGIGLIRLKNWARISIIAFSGITVFFGGSVLAFLLAMPFPVTPAGPPINPSVVKSIMVLVYGLPVLISIWWLVLFNRESTKAQFAGMPSESLSGIPVGPSCPLPVQIIAVFYLFSLLWVFVIPFLKMPIPAIFFGHATYGAGGQALFGFTFVLLGIGAIGLLKLQKWSYPLVLGMQGFWLLSGAVTFFSPNYAGLMQDMLSQMHLPENTAFPYSGQQLQFFSLFGLLFSLLPIGILISYRRRFLEAAAGRAARREADPISVR
jgi:hypothetical protein